VSRALEGFRRPSGALVRKSGLIPRQESNVIIRVIS